MPKVHAQPIRARRPVAPSPSPAAPAHTTASGPLLRPSGAQLTAGYARAIDPPRPLAARAVTPFAAAPAAPAVVQRFQLGNLAFSTRDDPNRAVPGSIYFNAGGGNRQGRIRLGHNSGPEISHVPVGRAGNQVSVGSAASMLHPPGAVRDAAIDTDRQTLNAARGTPGLAGAIAANTRPLAVGGPGRLYEYHSDPVTNALLSTQGHLSRGAPQVEGGIANQAHLNDIVNAAQAGQASVTAAKQNYRQASRAYRHSHGLGAVGAYLGKAAAGVSLSAKTWYHNKNVNSTYLSPAGTPWHRRGLNWLRA
jgi:hypothetical protein